MKNRKEHTWAELELNCIHQVLADWEKYNKEVFGRSLQKPTFQLHDGRSRLGYWHRGDRLISLSRSLVFEESWLKVRAVLKHEMLHQFLEESMGVVDAPPHGEIFKSMEKKLGIETYEEIGLEQAGQESQTGILDKVKKLLALAQSDQPHEAESAMSKANALMLKWNLNHSDLSEQRKHSIRHLGEASKIFAHLKILSCLLRDFFFVDTLWVYTFCPHKGKEGRVLEILGRPENVELAEYVYHYILNYGDRQWKEHRKSVKGGSRMNFLYGVILGFYEKCDRGRELQREEGLVWKGEAWLAELMAKRHPRTRKTTPSRGQLDQESFLAGKKQGEQMVLRRGMQSGSGVSALGKGLKGLLDKS
jgi:predicted SprT family Zn-dependent metalloprotease